MKRVGRRDARSLLSNIKSQEPAHKARYTAVACYLRAMNEIALRDQIVAAWSDRSLLQQDSVRDAVAEVMRALDKGALRVAQPEPDGSWKVNEWVKQAVLLNFPSKPWRRWKSVRLNSMTKCL